MKTGFTETGFIVNRSVAGFIENRFRLPVSGSICGHPESQVSAIWGGPAECAGALGEILRGLEICRFEIGDMDFCCGFDTPALA